MNLRLLTLFIGSGMYIASLTQPVWSCVGNDIALSGSDVLLSGILGLLQLDPRWFCNAVVMIALFSFNRPPKHGWISFVLAAIATTTIAGPYICDPWGEDLIGEGKAFALGGYLWIVSLWIFALSTVMHAKPVTDAHRKRGR